MAFWAVRLAAIVLTSAMAGHVPENGYTERMFREAVEQRGSSSPPFVLVTIVDAATGAEKTGCTEASALAAAVALQMGWTRENPRPSADEVDDVLIKAKERRFTFTKARWLAGSGYYSMDRNEQACVLLRKGISAFRADLTGKIIAGTPDAPLKISPPQAGS